MDSKYLEEWIPRYLIHYGNVLIPAKYIKRWGVQNMQVVLATVTSLDVEIVEEISYQPSRGGRLKKLIDYIAKKKVEKKEHGEQSDYFGKNYEGS